MVHFEALIIKHKILISEEWIYNQAYEKIHGSRAEWMEKTKVLMTITRQKYNISYTVSFTK